MARQVRISVIDTDGKQIKLPVYLVIATDASRQFCNECHDAVELAHDISRGGETALVIDLQIGHMFACYKDGKLLDKRLSLCEVHNEN